MSRYQINQTKFLTELEIEKLESIIKRASKPIHRLIIEVALKTGARATEVIRLRVSDLNHHDRTLFIRGIKGSNDREIPLSDDLYRRLNAYAKTLKGERLFPISYQGFVFIWKTYRPVKKKLHSLRHTFAIELYKRHRDLRLVQVALGHRNIQNTMVYAEYHYAATELRKLIC